ncbi:MAG TPA: multicopper oxidase domain-containing protein [Candidatus Dormibacteraeota bacterium]|nr:multicopper oxidase domain-containing protein [Candidatus Dormibacteraeota bacterium]
MRAGFRYSLLLVVCGFSFATASAQCPPRPIAGSVVEDALSLSSQNGVLNAAFTMGTSVDDAGYTHYCYKYKSSNGVVEAPTLRLNQGDLLQLNITDDIVSNGAESMSSMDMSSPPGACGDGGTATINSTNVHFHGLNVPPICHQDDVLTTLIQPGSSGFQYGITIPTTEPPGLYWYHPHVHGFTEFQVNGGAAGALIVEGMEKVRPEVTGLTERVFVIRQQYLVPWVPGPYQLTINYQVAGEVQGPTPMIEMSPGKKEFWRVANATLQDFMPLQVWFNGVPQKLELIALDGYPLAAPRFETTILIPPAGRAEFIVQPPPTGTSALFLTQAYSTGPTGNPDLEQVLATVKLSTTAAAKQPAKPVEAAAQASAGPMKFSGLKDATITATRKLYFSEEFGGINGPIQFYITVDGQKEKVFEPNEKPVITTKVGAIEDWTIENRALETHAFHMHQIHFLLLEVDGKPVANQDLRDTIQIPYWSGSGPYHSVKVRMDFSDPTIAGTFVFHCHILLHEDLGMMHKIQVMP